MKAFVLSPEMAKQQVASIIHFFSIGQFDILIVLNEGYPEAPVLKELNFIINFELPDSYKRYKENGGYIDVEEGAIISLVTPEEEKKTGMLSHFQKKMSKSFSRTDMLKCIPIRWHEITKMKGRVDQVLGTLSNKRVRDEKVLEFKKQVVSNKSLKEYFKNNPTEKIVLQNDIQKNSYSDKVLFKHLDTLPFYCVPKEIMATTPDQLQMCTAGTGQHVPGWVQGGS